jgi:hypothetical protein
MLARERPVVSGVVSGRPAGCVGPQRMATLNRIDSFLIDRMFQPAVDRLAPLISCYVLAEFVATGGLLAHAGAYIVLAVTRTPFYLLSLLAETAWVPLMIARAHSLDRRPPSSALPSDRVIGQLPRMLLLLITLPLLPLFLVTAPTIEDLAEVGWWLLLFAVYLMACRRPPPHKKRARQPRLGWFSAAPAR